MSQPYASGKPSFQQTLDLFAGNWVSAFPTAAGPTSAGTMPLFDDPRITWAADRFAAFGLPVAHASVVELGPLEGGHTYMLSRLGARSVTALEANRESYLRCLVAKELLGIERVNFLYGDAIEYLRSENVHFDLSIACGFLYHMVNPVELIELLCRRSSAVFLWTVFWDPAFNVTNQDSFAASGATVESEHAGFKHRLHRHEYGTVADLGKFYGGPAPHSNWMELGDILGAFAHFGFGNIVHELEKNPYGSALRLAATKNAR